MSSSVPAVMIQGAGSNVGKSILVAGLARAFTARGLKVRPFKSQNMSNNAAATPDGGEIGRAQALQALAAGVPPSVHMNPVLLKPETDTGAQIIVHGKRFGTMRAREFGERKGELLPAVLESFAHLEAAADLILVEGAGSPAEVNLRAGDIANMGFAEAADVPVVVAGDIERGGVIASLVGTYTVLPGDDRARIKAFLINKFRGDTGLFDDGLAAITRHTGWPSLGVVPWFENAGRLPAEDILDIGSGPVHPAAAPGARRVRIAVPQLRRIANFDDLDPLKLEPDVDLDIIRPGRPLPRDTDLILLPGSKNTVADLEALRAEGWDIDIAAHARHGGHVLGICGGFQMLGHTISDPQGIEGRAGVHTGLGLLDVTTVLEGDKVVRPVTGHEPASGAAITGYEIHLGRTEGPDCARPFLVVEGRDAGASNASGTVTGAYVHGMFASDTFRRAFLARFGATLSAHGPVNYAATVDATLDALAAHLETHLNLDALLAIASTR